MKPHALLSIRARNYLFACRELSYPMCIACIIPTDDNRRPESRGRLDSLDFRSQRTYLVRYLSQCMWIIESAECKWSYLYIPKTLRCIFSMCRGTSGTTYKETDAQRGAPNITQRESFHYSRTRLYISIPRSIQQVEPGWLRAWPHGSVPLKPSSMGWRRHMNLFPQTT